MCVNFYRDMTHPKEIRFDEQFLSPQLLPPPPPPLSLSRNLLSSLQPCRVMIYLTTLEMTAVFRVFLIQIFLPISQAILIWWYLEFGDMQLWHS